MASAMCTALLGPMVALRLDLTHGSRLNSACDHGHSLVPVCAVAVPCNASLLVGWPTRPCVRVIWGTDTRNPKAGRPIDMAPRQDSIQVWASKGDSVVSSC